jgi:nucleotide-sensitive chloride channel 1A
MRPWHPPADEGDDNTPAAPAPLDGVGLAGGPCIYCQIDEAGGTEADAEAEDGYEGIIRDLVLTPTDASASASLTSLPVSDALTLHACTVEPIFEAISHCASLHPSHLDDDDDGPTFGDGFAQADDDDLDDVGRVRSDFAEPSSRFKPY